MLYRNVCLKFYIEMSACEFSQMKTRKNVLYPSEKNFPYKNVKLIGQFVSYVCMLHRCRQISGFLERQGR